MGKALSIIFVNHSNISPPHTIKVSTFSPHPEGRFTIDDVPEGWVTVAAWAQGYAPGKTIVSPVVPGDTLHIHIATRQHRGSVWKFDCEARVEGVLTSQATIAAMILDD